MDSIDWEDNPKISTNPAIQELYDTELVFLNDLRLIQEVFFVPLSKARLLGGPDLKKIFLNCPELLLLSEEICDGLSTQRNCVKVFNRQVHLRQPTSWQR